MTTILTGSRHPVYAAFGRWIVKRRKAIGLTQAELAQLLGWSPQKLSGIECGRQRVALDQFLTITEALDS